MFLSEDIILLPNREGRLEVVRLPDTSSNSQSSSFTRLAAFMLPETQPICTLGTVQCRAEPNPTGAPHPTLNTEHAEFAARLRARKRSPIVPDPAKALVLFQLYYREFNTEADAEVGMWGILRHNVSLAVHRSTLLDVIQEATEKNLFISADAFARMGLEMTGPSMPIIPWSFWGPRARWHANDIHVSNWITVSAGQRYIGVHESGRIVVKDYNPYTVRRAKAWIEAHRGPDATAASEYLTEDEDEDMDEVEEGNQSQDGSWVDVSEAFTSDATDVEHAIPVPPPVHDSTTIAEASRRGEDTEDPSVDNSWANVRVIEEYGDEEYVELDRLFKETAGPLPCVEYWSREDFEYHGYLMDEERIIGLRVSALSVNLR